MAAKSREETPKEGCGSSATAMQYMTLRRTNYKRDPTLAVVDSFMHLI
jgi:hypothetical protein